MKLTAVIGRSAARVSPGLQSSHAMQSSMQSSFLPASKVTCDKNVERETAGWRWIRPHLLALLIVCAHEKDFQRNLDKIMVTYALNK